MLEYSSSENKSKEKKNKITFEELKDLIKVNL